MTKKLIIAAMSLSLVSSVFAQDGSCDNAMANDNAPCEKESCQADPMVDNGAKQEGQTPDCGNCPEAAQ